MENPVWIDDFLENLKRAKERWDDPEYKAKLDEAFEQAADIMEWLKYLAVFAAGALAVYFVFIKK